MNNMLNEIKVYRRSDAKEINGEQIRIGFGESLWLFVGADSTPQEEKFKLTKADPLNKFKKEMEGWLFCEKYVVIEHNTSHQSLGEDKYIKLLELINQ
jgi:hypothetical protein